MAGMRIALSISILLLIYAELFAATEGLGFYILNAQQLFLIPEMWAGIFVLSIFAYVVNLLRRDRAPGPLLAPGVEGLAAR